jgi:acyl-CoA synthetase (AMP-forming)/AMP-acid ligase II
MTNDTRTVRALLGRGHGTALGSPGRPDFDYATLATIVDAAGRTTWRSSCTPRAPPRGRRSCRSPRGTSCTSARSIADTLRLGPEDRCLNIMPLFHIHGLIAAVLRR